VTHTTMPVDTSALEQRRSCTEWRRDSLSKLRPPAHKTPAAMRLNLNRVTISDHRLFRVQFFFAQSVTFLQGSQNECAAMQNASRQAMGDRNKEVRGRRDKIYLSVSSREN